MPISDTGIAVGDRLPPTAEDQAIFLRNLRRLKRWNGTKKFDQTGMVAIRNFTADYLHFKPRKDQP